MVFELSRLPWVRRVVFVNPQEVWLRDELPRGAGRSLGRLGRALGLGSVRIDGKIEVLEVVRFLPLKRIFPAASALEEKLFRRRLRAARGDGEYLLLNNHPNFFSRPLLDELSEGAKLSLYDLSDDFVEYHRTEEDRAMIDDSVRYACAKADVVLAINDHLCAKYGGDDTYEIRNSTNYRNFARDHYRSVPFLDQLKSTGQPIIGYTGIINSIRVDYELLRGILDARPEWNFVFIGSSDRSFRALAAEYPHVTQRDAVDYEALPDHVAYFDATIVPFHVNEHTRGNDLLKFNDYLAMGKVVVTTNTGGAERYGDLLTVAGSADEFVASIESATGADSAELRKRRQAFAEKNSWSERVLEIEAIIRDHLQRSETKTQDAER